jgi:hypothetical protein
MRPPADESTGDMAELRELNL